MEPRLDLGGIDVRGPEHYFLLFVRPRFVRSALRSLNVAVVKNPSADRGFGAYDRSMAHLYRADLRRRNWS